MDISIVDAIMLTACVTTECCKYVVWRDPELSPGVHSALNCKYQLTADTAGPGQTQRVTQRACNTD